MLDRTPLVVCVAALIASLTVLSGVEQSVAAVAAEQPDSSSSSNNKNDDNYVGNLSVRLVSPGDGDINEENSSRIDAAKLNVSWLLPTTSSDDAAKKPSFYSVQITSITDEHHDDDDDDSGSSLSHNSACGEGTIYHVVHDVNVTSVLLPEYRFEDDDDAAMALELELEPACTYRIDFVAHPRPSSSDQLTDHDNYRSLSVIRTVVTLPECIGNWCNCERIGRGLPVPELRVQNLDDQSVLIDWTLGTDRDISGNNDSSTATLVRSYHVSAGVPHLTSATGLVIYNRTTIFRGNSSSFVWHHNDSSLHQLGAKIFATSLDSHGCPSNESSIFLRKLRHAAFYRKNVAAIVFVCFILMFFLSGALVTLVRRWMRKPDYKFANLDMDKFKPRAFLHQQESMYETLLNQRNVLYVEQEIVEARRKDLADEYEISFNRLSIVTELGHGQFGKVYLAQLDGAAGGEGRNSAYSNANLVAVKMSRAHDPSELQQDLLEEIRITKLVGSHPHLVSMIGCCTLPENPICLVLEYMKGGDLLRYLHAVRAAGTVEVSSPLTLSSNDSPDELSIAETTCTSLHSQSPSSPSPQQQQQQHQPQFSRDSRVFFPNNDIKAVESGGCKFECSGGGERVKGTLSHAEMMHFGLHIARGMEHLEAKGIVHRDLAARNVLMSEHLVLKISDFGLSRRGDYFSRRPGGQRPLPIRWMPAEAIRQRSFTSKSDVWSYGLVLWEIVSYGDFPYPRLSDDRLLHHLLEEDGRPDLRELQAAPAELKQLMNMCWAREPANRPTFQQIVMWLENKIQSTCENNITYKSSA
ncbi:mast/stem cell growth factor receptor Kit-like isoform X1 [Trichogramma pretiosum]|uniref:mast/stem cell growth factor receptor Kit-like isoform X1 n=1 Tax=Trichogramma pretiosum TaxID=7493 RepID=UPI000C71BC74|nr:mast/stem cell growth factor receptor Kit-like isoform X1 [Trichogramma pretiosum]